MSYRSILSFAAIAAAQPALAAVDADGTVVVTATRSGEPVPIGQVVSSVTVITAQDMVDRQVRLVSDVLRDVPGIAVSRAGNPGGYTQVRLRGTEANHVLVLIDGIKVSDPFQGEYDFAGLVADPGVQIEVLRGQQSSLYG
jgi:vitamin B12 transporter